MAAQATRRLAHEDRLESSDVVVLVAEAEDVVVEEHVAGMDVARELLRDVRADGAQREAEDGQVLRLLEHAPSRVVEPGHEVARLAQDGRARRLLHADAHLVRDRLEGAADDGDEDLVDFDMAHDRPSFALRHGGAMGVDEAREARLVTKTVVSRRSIRAGPVDHVSGLESACPS